MKYFAGLLLFLPFLLSAQVVNTEKMRINRSESGVTGEIDLSLGLTRNKAGQTVRLGAGSRLEWLRTKSRWLVLGGYNLSEFRDVEGNGSASRVLLNNGFGHLRYNRDLNQTITWEAFIQTQFDKVQAVRVRQLAGSGPRLQLVREDSLTLFLGLLYMYEYEETSEQVDIVYNRDHRMSSYLSIGFQPTSYLSVNHVGYFQPNLRDFHNDFRITSETTLDVRLSSKLNLRTYFQFIYDEKPPAGIPRTMYVLTNGVSWRF